jgi:hypothetical protein
MSEEQIEILSDQHDMLLKLKKAIDAIFDEAGYPSKDEMESDEENE